MYNKKKKVSLSVVKQLHEINLATLSPVLIIIVSCSPDFPLPDSF